MLAACGNCSTTPLPLLAVTSPAAQLGRGAPHHTGIQSCARCSRAPPAAPPSARCAPCSCMPGAPRLHARRRDTARVSVMRTGARAACSGPRPSAPSRVPRSPRLRLRWPGHACGWSLPPAAGARGPTPRVQLVAALLARPAAAPCNDNSRDNDNDKSKSGTATRTALIVSQE
jgi:hypothetical protein